MNEQDIALELLNEENIDKLRAIHREDISEDFVDGVDTIMEITQYGIDHQCVGHTYAIKYKDNYIGAYVLEKVIDNCYREYGIRPIALGCHKDNHEAAKFYVKHGFVKTDVMEENDYYYLQYPENNYG